MSTDRRKALQYIGAILAIILIGSFWMVSVGEDIPEFIRVIAVSMAISLASMLT